MANEEKIAEYIVPQVYEDYARSTDSPVYSNAFMRSGAVVEVPQLQGFLQGGGARINLPSWQTNLIEEMSASAVDYGATITPNEWEARNEIALRIYRELALQQDLVQPLYAGADPMELFAPTIEKMWMKNINGSLVASCRGVIADNIANDASDLVNDIAGAGVGLDTITNEEIIKTIGLRGDASDDMVLMVCHSKVRDDLRNQNLIEYRPASEQSLLGTPDVPYYLGSEIYVDDSLSFDNAGTENFITMFVRRNAFAFAQDFGNAPFQTDNNVLASGGQQVVVARRQYMIHPSGFAADDTLSATTSPTDAFLTAAATWDRVVSTPKLAPFTALVSRWSGNASIV